MNCRIVVTNDDGVDSAGIQVLARYLEKAGHDVTIIAPDYDASGTGTSLGTYSASRPIRFKETKVESFGGSVFAVAGPPALCSLLASNEAFCNRPDLVVSGINAGMNVGRSVVHSGTVGAAIAAQNFGMRGLAVSVGGADQWYWECAADIALQVVPSILSGPDRSVTNVNVPGLPIESVKGLKWGHLARLGSVRGVVKRLTSSNIYVENVRTDYNPERNTDLALTREGFATITCLQGATEVWNSFSIAGEEFDVNSRVCGAMAGDSVCPPLAYASQI
ncbi:MAG: 5'/3'-nucleotidase SurE [Gammaproteobacteria bacterium]|nr:5'/3'-nucleotidase SurE [Gammaproteobacteria bacterium]